MGVTQMDQLMKTVMRLPGGVGVKDLLRERNVTNVL